MMVDFLARNGTLCFTQGLDDHILWQLRDPARVYLRYMRDDGSIVSTYQDDIHPGCHASSRNIRYHPETLNVQRNNTSVDPTQPGFDRSNLQVNFGLSSCPNETIMHRLHSCVIAPDSYG